MTVPTAYLAPVSWYRAVLCEPCEVEVWESFPKQTLRNRCRIAGPNGVQTLTVPVQKCERKQYTRDVKIAWQTDWRHRHRQALQSAYRSTPYFDYYADFFQPVYEQRFTFLTDLNEALHDVVMRLLTAGSEVHPAPLSKTKEWQATDCDKAFTGAGTQPYYQLFADRQGFQENLSIADLLFNTGPEALLYLL